MLGDLKSPFQQRNQKEHRGLKVNFKSSGEEILVVVSPKAAGEYICNLLRYPLNPPPILISSLVEKAVGLGAAGIVPIPFAMSPFM